MTISASEKYRVRAALIFALKLAVVVGAVAYLFLSRRLKLDQLVLSPDGFPWAAGTALTVLFYMLVSQIRFWTVLEGGGVRIQLSKVVQVGLISWSANALLMGGAGAVSGDAIRVAYLTRYHSGPAILIVASLVDRALGAFVLVIAAGVFLPTLFARGPGSEALQYLPSLYAIIAAIIIFWLSAYLGISRGVRLAFVAWALASVCAALALIGFFGPKLLPLVLLVTIGAGGPLLPLLATPRNNQPSAGTHWSIRGIRALIDGTVHYVRRPGTLLIALLLSIAVQALAITSLFCVARAISVPEHPSWLQTLVAGVPAIATTLLPLPANGLGVGEATYDALLRAQVDAAGQPLVGGAAIYLAFRAITLLTSLLGLPFLLMYRHQHPVDKELTE